MMLDYRNFVRAILIFGAISAAKYARASEQSVFSSGNDVYRMKYTTTIKVVPAAVEADYLTKAYRHSNYLVGQLAYVKRRENSSATGAPLRKKEDVKVTKVKIVDATTAELTYAYDGEVVLDRSELETFTLYLPENYEAIEKLGEDEIAACSFQPGFVSNEDLLSFYWFPFAKNCEIPHQTLTATLTPAPAKVTYPDYPRLVKDGVITVALLVGKMEENSNHNPYRGDESAIEYKEVIKRLKKLGFIRTNTVVPEDLDHSYEETFEATLGEIKMVVNLVYGNSVYATEDQMEGVRDFYRHYLKLAKSSSFVVYSGHAGFLLTPGSLGFHEKYPLVLDQDRYQIFVMNGCQTTVYAHPMFSVKGTQNLDLFVNSRETIINSKASTAILDAIAVWAKYGTWTSYPKLVGQMDAVDAMLGVVGEQDNPLAPYSPSK